MERIKIQDEVYLNFIENSKYKTNYINLSFISPLTEESASYDSLLSRVLIRGTKKYPNQLLLNRALDDAYETELSSDVSKIGEKHTLEISECILDDAYKIGDESITEKAIDILAEVAFDPYCENGGFNAEYVSSEKKFAIDDIDSQINNKAKYSIKEMISIMCKGEPFAADSIGKKSIIKKITPQSLYEYYKKLVSDAKIEIFFVGRFNKGEVEKKIRGIFAKIKRDPKPIPATIIRSDAGKLREKTEQLDIAQSNLVMGFRTGETLLSRDWPAMSLYNAVLGGCLTSKLFTVLREKMSLCYTITSQCDGTKGIMFIYAGISKDKKDISVNEAINQMKLIEKGEVTEEELESARGYLINSLTGIWDNPAVLPDWFLVRACENSSDDPDDVIAKLKKVRLEDVIAVSKKIKLDTVYFLTGKGE